MIIIPLLLYFVLSLTFFYLLRWLRHLERVEWWEFLIYVVVYLSWLTVFYMRFSHKGFGNLILEPILLSLLPPVYLLTGKFANGEQEGAIKMGLMTLSGAAVIVVTLLAPRLGDWP